MSGTHYSSLKRQKRVLYNTLPSEPRTGDFYFDNFNNRWAVYDTNQWYFAQLSTTTSTSSSTSTTTSTSTSTSTSTTSSTTTSTSTSTTTTL